MKTTKFEVLIDALKEKFTRVLDGGYTDNNFYRKTLCEAVMKNKHCRDYLEVYNYMQVVCGDISVIKIKQTRSLSGAGFTSEIYIDTCISSTDEKICIILDANFSIDTLSPQDVLLCITIAMAEVVYGEAKKLALEESNNSTQENSSKGKDSVSISLDVMEDDILAIKNLVDDFHERLADSKLCMDITVTLPSGTKFTINLYDPKKGLE
jgi:hypothetical protein